LVVWNRGTGVRIKRQEARTKNQEARSRRGEKEKRFKRDYNILHIEYLV